jgi:hypothetical protein
MLNMNIVSFVLLRILAGEEPVDGEIHSGSQSQKLSRYTNLNCEEFNSSSMQTSISW